MEKLIVERSIWIAAARERVWEAITDAAQINQWWGGDDQWQIAALQVGATVQFAHRDIPILATIGVLDPPRQFSIQWPPEQNHSVLKATTYTLEAEKGGTRVTVTETGFEALPDDIRQTRYDRTAQGYATVLEGLKTHVERSNA